MRFVIAALSLLVASSAFADAQVGAEAPAFSLTDSGGKKVTLADYKGKIVVLEWLNPNCPFVKRHTAEKTMSNTYGKHSDVVWIGIDSTVKGHQDFMTPEQLAKWGKDNGLAYPVLVDGDGAVGKLYGAKTTPHLFIVGRDGKVAYAGAIDDDPSGKTDTAKRKNYVDQALTAIKSGGKPADLSTKSYGCSVKYGS